MKKQLYTTGEIYRLKLLLNRDGKPYGDKAAVAKMVGRLEYVVTQTAWGQPTKCLSLSAINKHNANIKARLLEADKKQ